ncbi:MAG: LamG domain-containing protein [Chloroflexota bacterium]
MSLETTGLSLSFDGQDDYVELGALGLSTSHNTIEFWLKIAETPVNDMRIMSVLSGTTSDFGLRFQDGRIQVWRQWQYVTSTVIPIDTWTHVALVRNGNQVTGFVNGVQELTVSNSAAAYENLALGHKFLGRWGSFFKGQLDEVRIWNVVRSQAEIADNMSHQLTGNEAGLVAYYQVNDGAGSAVLTNQADASKPGQIYGNPTWGEDCAVAHRPAQGLEHIKKFQSRKWRGRVFGLRQRVRTSREVVDNRISEIKQALANGQFGHDPNYKFVDKKTVEHVIGQLTHLSNMQESIHDVYLSKGWGIARHLAADFVAPHKINYGHYLQEHLLDTLLGQCMDDAHILQQAFDQRRNLGSSEYDDRLANILFDADVTARVALQPAIDAGYFAALPTIITYFDLAMTARTLPYYNAMLMSIPLQAKAINSRDFSYVIIPHEIGHLLYWHGTVPNGSGGGGTPVHQALKDALNFADNDWRLAWLEELFADFYGCKVIGPANVLGFQEMLSDDSRSEFVQNPKKHPIAALRPYIQSDMLRLIAPESEPTLRLLDDRWQAIMELRGESDNHLAQRYADLNLTGQEIIDGIKEISEGMNNVFGALNLNKQWWNPQSLNANSDQMIDFREETGFDHFEDLADERGDIHHIDLSLYVEVKSYLLTKVNQFTPADAPHLFTVDQQIPLTNAYLHRWEQFVSEWKNTPEGTQALDIADYHDLIFVAGWSTGGGDAAGSGNKDD